MKINGWRQVDDGLWCGVDHLGYPIQIVQYEDGKKAIFGFGFGHCGTSFGFVPWIFITDEADIVLQTPELAGELLSEFGEVAPNFFLP